jgi:hypothetical protein
MKNHKIIIMCLLIVMSEHNLLMFAVELLLFIFLIKEYLKTIKT